MHIFSINLKESDLHKLLCIVLADPYEAYM